MKTSVSSISLHPPTLDAHKHLGEVHRLTAALAFTVRLSPFWSSIQGVLQLLQCKEVLESKLSGSGWSKSEGVGQKSSARKIIQDVITLMSHSV